jgi:hypothetical protein
MSHGPNHRYLRNRRSVAFFQHRNPVHEGVKPRGHSESAERSRREPRIRYCSCGSVGYRICISVLYRLQQLDSSTASAHFHVMNYSEHDERSVKHQPICHATGAATEFAKANSSGDSGSSSKRQCRAQHECSACYSSPPRPATAACRHATHTRALQQVTWTTVRAAPTTRRRQRRPSVATATPRDGERMRLRHVNALVA